MDFKAHLTRGACGKDRLLISLDLPPQTRYQFPIEGNHQMLRLFAVLTALVLCVPASQAASYNYYGAIAISPDNGASGRSTNRGTYENARDWALYYCGSYADDCTVAVYFVNTCAAVARGGNGGYAAGRSIRVEDAQRSAVRSCSTVDSGCRVLTSACSRGSR